MCISLLVQRYLLSLVVSTSVKTEYALIAVHVLVQSYLLLSVCSTSVL